MESILGLILGVGVIAFAIAIKSLEDDDSISKIFFTIMIILGVFTICIPFLGSDKTSETKVEEKITEENCIKDKELSKQVSELIGKEVTICE